MKQSTILLAFTILALANLSQANQYPRLLNEISPIRLLSNNSNNPLANACVGIKNNTDYGDFISSSASQVIDILRNFRGNNSLYDLVNSNDSPEEFGKQYGFGMIPFVAVGVVFFLLTVLSCLFYTFNCCCCNSCCRPKASNTNLCGVCAVVFIGATLLIAFLGMVASGYMEEGVESISCQGVELLGVFIYGNETAKWIGLSPVLSKLIEVTEEITTTINNFPDIDSKSQELEDLYNDGTGLITDFYENNKDSTVRDPATASGTLTPDFITELGPTTQNDTASGALRAELDEKYDIVEQVLSEVGDAVEELKNQSSTINDTLNSAIDIARDLNYSLGNITQGYEDNQETSSKFLGYLEDGLKIYFITFGVFMSIFLISMLSLLMCKKDPCRVFTRCGYVCIGILTMIAFILSAVLLPVSVAVLDMCNVVDQVFNNQNFTDRLITDLENQTLIEFDAETLETIRNVTDTCLYGNGDLSQYLGIQDQLDDFDQIFEGINEVGNKFNDSVPNSYIVPPTNDTIYSFKYGLFPATDGVKDELVTLNQLTDADADNSQQTCDVSYDIWVINSTNCSDHASGDPVFKSTDAANFNFGTAICMSLTAWGNKNPDDRYQGNYPSCPNVGSKNFDDAIIDSVNGFVQYQSDMETLFDSLATDLKAYSDKNDEFMTEAKTLVDPIFQINDTAHGILDIIADNQTGIINNIRCQFLGDEVQELTTAICGNFLTTVTYTFLMITFIAVFSCMATLPVFCAAKLLSASKNGSDDDDDDDERPEKHIELAL